MRWFATATAILLLGIGLAIADRSTNRGLTIGYYGELNRLTAAFSTLPGISIQSVGYNPDLTLEEIWFHITDSQVPRYIQFNEDDPIRDLSGEELKTALARGLAVMANYPRDPRLLVKPAVVAPTCDFFPRNYGGWNPDVVGLSISLEEGVTDSAREAERLARKYGFAYQLKGRRPRQYLAVPWLEPEQVAALRCEDSVLGIWFRLPDFEDIKYSSP